MSKDNRKLRAIDSHTLYDVPARLTRLARNIRDGHFGAVSDVVIGVRYFDQAKQDWFTSTHHLGRSDMNVAMCTLSRMKNTLLGN